MTSELDSTKLGPSERRNLRRYFWGFGISMLAYLVVLFVAMPAQEAAESPWRILILLAPIVPVGFAFAAVLQFIRGLDEYQTRTLTTALSWGFAVAMLTAVVVGFLDFVLTVPLPSWIIFVAGMMGWVVAAVATARR
ncbi:hypothetical protein [Leucobacter sp. 7(1)]|uniref:hypothetical protein n=1 Tax=Leucobacter sp. 7(1) TaxID=1255613 RepID=UPI000B353064|nr:hypothetical protein [Leucobacter sp. 7(1)]